jgi:hypothetical protein
MSGPAEDALSRAEALQARLESVRARLTESDDPERAVEAMTELAQIAKEIEAELERARREADAGT